MAKRDNKTNRTPEAEAMADAIEQRVVAFAEQLGRIAGTLHAKAEGLIDRETLSQQIGTLRDGATDLLEQMANGAMKVRAAASKQMREAAKTTQKPAGAAQPRSGAKGRSGGMVDARGKKHRKPMPSDPGANVADSQAAKVRAAKTMVKTSKRRGRG